MKLRMRTAIPPLVPLFGFVVLFEFLVRSGIIPSYIVPAPSEVFAAMMEIKSELFSAALGTMTAAVVGLVLSFLIGSAFAICLSLSEFARRAFYPYAVFFQTVPIIAVAPILVIWFGFGQPTVIASAFIVSIFPVIASTLLGLRSTDPALIDLFKLYSASPFKMMWRLRLPYALPEIFSGLRIAAGLSVIGAIVGEFIGGGGLGSVVDTARTMQRIDQVFAAVLVSSVIGLVMIALINYVSWWTLKNWHNSERSEGNEEVSGVEK
jgi:NitT/TauT family transport system permease protein